MTTQLEKDAAVAKAHAAVDELAALVVVTPTQPNPAILSFTATPTFLPPGGGTVTLAWTTQNADRAALEYEDQHLDLAASGELQANINRTTRFTLTAWRAGLSSTAVTLQVDVMSEPQTGSLVPTIGSARSSQQLNFAQADWVDLAKLPAPVPWTYPNTTAPSQNGVRPTKWRRLHPWGCGLQLYSACPIVEDGRVVQQPANIGVGNAVDIVAADLKANPPPVGARGLGLVDPYITWQGHPEAGPLYLGIRVDGAFLALMADGSSFIFGWFPQAKVPLDFCFSPDRMIFYVADTDNGRILKVDRTVARAARPPGGIEDWRLWVVTDFATGLGRVTSVRCTSDGSVHACDNAGGRLLSFAPDGTASVPLALAGAFFVDVYSDDTLGVLDSHSGVFVVDPRMRTVGPNLTPPERRIGLQFGTISIDRNGNLGHKDDAYWMRSLGQQNGNEAFRVSRDGEFNSNPFGGSDGSTWIGDMSHGTEIYHYPWVFTTHPTFGIMLCQGFGNVLPTLIRPWLASDPDEGVYDHRAFTQGIAVLSAGAPANAVGRYPSFSALMNVSGWGNLGCTADYVAEMPFAGQMTFIQNGMIGSFKRPDLVGYDLYALMYMLNRSSQRFLREGATLVNGLLAWFRTNFGTPAPTAPPIVPSYATSLYMLAEKVGDIYQIALRDKDENQKPIPAGTVFNVVVDQGMPFAVDLGNIGSPWTVAPSLPDGQHALTIHLVAGGASNYVPKTRIYEFK